MLLKEERDRLVERFVFLTNPLCLQFLSLSSFLVFMCVIKMYVVLSSKLD